jgi:hypothetical protein
MDSITILLIVFSFIQAIAILVGGWVGKNIIELKVVMAEVRVGIGNQERRIFDLEAWQQQADKKLIQLWSIYQREQRDSRGNLSSHKR